MKNTIIIITLLVFSITAYGQSLKPEWHFNTGAKSHYGWIDKTFKDDSGNIYNVGMFRGTVDFDPSVVDFELSADLTYDDGYIFIQKLNSYKELVWVKSLGNEDSRIHLEDVVMDDNANIYIAGNYSNLLFLGSGLSGIKGNRGGTDFFMAKYDRNGNLLWGYTGGSDEDDNIRGLDIKSGRLLLTGYIGGETDFDLSVMEDKYTPTENRETFTASYSLNANLQWVKLLEGAYSEPTAVAEDAEGNVIITGLFANPNNSFRNDVFIYKYSGTGVFRWFKFFKIAAGNYIYPSSLAIRGNGDVVVAGRYAGTVDWNARPDITENSTSVGSTDYFLCGLNKDGDYLWNLNNGSTNTEANIVLEIDAQDNIYLSGSYGGTIDVDKGVNSQILSPTNSDALFVQKINKENDLVYAFSFDGRCDINSLSTSSDGLILSGSLFTDMDFAGYEVKELPVGTDGDIFTIHLAECDINTKLKNAANILETEATGTYQWLDCSNGFAPIAGATSGRYTATQDGSYAVQITSGNCVDTSECIFLSKVGVRESEQYTTAVYPNPSSGTIHIKTGTPLSTITLYNAHGQEVMHIDGKELTGQSLQLPGTKGLYYLQLESSQGTETHRVIRY